MMSKDLDDTDRLLLIKESIVYCKKVRSMGMPASCYSKALREPIHFLWERRKGSKLESADYISHNAAGLSYGYGKIIYDHSIPFSYLRDELLELSDLSIERIAKILARYPTAIITKEEDAQLVHLGLRNKMPSNWDGIDPLSRYHYAGIKVRKVL